MRLDGLQQLLERRLSIRQLLYLAAVGSVLLGAYLVIGLFWAGSHYHHLAEVRGADKVFSVLGEIVAWPVLIVADIQLR
ncbi:hypothetical protein [Mycolicibacter terrae]|uniref:hypothetical protein n=1 Tax=Mycolicibacter terrae TaxID=1788 RepID=UPI000A230C06|nr:hypothetical protein [Mycolicibacter terrae]ORW89605.1 hypothetical protein AWC28_20800 [Mycolicibacter terrae]SNV80489.1 membrane protein [Mycolicibacter terrae]